MKITEDQIIEIIKEEIQAIFNENEDDTLPSVYVPPKALEKIKRTAMEIYDIFKGMFAGENITLEDLQDKLYQVGNESPRVLDILHKQATERQINAAELNNFIQSVGVADLEAIDDEDPLLTAFANTELYDDDPIPPQF